ncbi:MAG: hypothetical protein ACR2JW_03250, partial [Thermomicrobiales bacterium]
DDLWARPITLGAWANCCVIMRRSLHRQPPIRYGQRGRRPDALRDSFKTAKDAKRERGKEKRRPIFFFFLVFLGVLGGLAVHFPVGLCNRL